MGFYTPHFKSRIALHSFSSFISCSNLLSSFYSRSFPTSFLNLRPGSPLSKDPIAYKHSGEAEILKPVFLIFARIPPNPSLPLWPAFLRMLFFLSGNILSIYRTWPRDKNLQYIKHTLQKSSANPYKIPGLDPYYYDPRVISGIETQLSAVPLLFPQLIF